MGRKFVPGFLFFWYFLFSLKILDGSATSFPTFTDISENSGFKVNSRGYSAAWGDFNNDGWVDVYICNTHSQPNVLYQNLGNGRFRDVTESAGVGGDEYSQFGCWLDLNSDWNQDLFVTNLYYENKFYLNNGDGTFTEMIDSLGISKGITAWIDLNHDGLLDVYVGRGNKFFSNAATAYNRFFLNTGGLKFRDYSTETCLLSEHYAIWPNWQDFNGDFLPDLYFASTLRKTAYLFRYNFTGTFSNVVQEASAVNFCGVNNWTDLDADGDQDYFMFENSGKHFTIFENRQSVFVPRILTVALKRQEDQFQDKNVAIDIDNDGLPDLQISSQKNDAGMGHQIELFRNQGNFEFEKVANAVPLDPNWDVCNLNWADIDNDGDWDCIAVLRDQLRLFQNNGNSNRFVKIHLQGTTSHPDGIGATLTVNTNSGNFRHWVGMGAGLQWRVRDQITIGIGQADTIQKIEVRWPSGIVQDTTAVSPNQTVYLKEPSTKWFDDQTVRSRLGNHVAKSMGGACADYDNDGDIDIYVVNSGDPSIFFENQGSAIFNDVSIATQLSQSATHLGALFFDFDNDGNKDFYVTSWYFQSNSIYQNQGDGTFRIYNAEARLGEENDSSFSIIVADFNNDGFVDLYQGQEGKNVLLLNSPNGYFVDYSQASGTQDPFLPHGMAAFDYDNDGDQDIYVANCRGGEDNYPVKVWPNILYRNNGDATFTDETRVAGVGCTANSKGVCVGDYDNDGFFDLYIANDDSANILFKNNGNGTFSDVTSQAGVAEPLGAHGCHFVDFDNDGFLDLYVSGSSYIPEKHDLSMNKDHPNVLYRNNGNGTFTDITRYSGIQHNIEQTPHILVADFDNDGYVDIHAGNSVRPGKKKARNTYFQNCCRGNNWVHFKLTGKKSNRDAIGARVQVKSGNFSMLRQVTYGFGFGSSHSELVYFGLGQNTQIDSVVIHWPSGIRQIITKNIRINQINPIEEPFQWGPIQLTAAELQWLFRTGAILLGILAAALLVRYLWPIIRKGWSLQKQERDKLIIQVLESQVFEIRIDLMPFKNDFLLIHSVIPLTRAAWETAAFQWGRQETTPFLFKSDKIWALRHRFGNIITQYLECVQHPTPDEKVLDELKETGAIIYNFLGLRGFFDTLFGHESIHNAQIHFVVDNLAIPWYLAYHEKSQTFLCEKFPNSSLFHSQPECYRPAFLADSVRKLTGTKAIITLFGSWPHHERELAEVPLEIKKIGRVFSGQKIDARKVEASVDEFLKTIHTLAEEKKDLRIIHYSGHIDHNLLALGPNEFFDPAQLVKTFGIHFESGPVIFLNGCEASELWQEKDEIATHFLNAGAAACIVTHARIPEKPARRFAVSFYEHYLEQRLTVAESLLQARLALTSDKRQPNYLNDITRFVYNLCGNPDARF